MTRTPKLDEVWTYIDGGSERYTCIDDVADDCGNYGWTWVDARDGDTRKAYFDIFGMTPPKAEPPEWLKAAPWLAVYADRSVGVWMALPPVPGDHPCTVGALNVLTGEWVSRG